MRINRIKLRIAMIEKDIGRNELAKLTGISTTTISNVENGKSCSNNTACAIAKALGIDLEEILER